MNAIPIVGWLISLVFAISLSLPFWLIWTVCGIGEKYFYWLPNLYLHIGFWDCVGLFIICDIIKQCVIPKFVSVTQTNKA